MLPEDTADKSPIQEDLMENSLTILKREDPSMKQAILDTAIDNANHKISLSLNILP